VSKQTAKLINWGYFDAIPSVAKGSAKVPPGSEDDQAYIKRVRDSFDRIRADFDKAL
jgi:hypothetical protein